MDTFKHNISIIVRRVCSCIFSHIPKEEGLVLCTAWFGQKYIDNTKYVYEYLLYNSKYHVWWLTRSDLIYEQLIRDGKPVIKFNSLLGIWKQIRAQAIFTTVQLAEFNRLYLTNVIHIDLGHGHPIKDPGARNWNSFHFEVDRMYLNNNFFYAICASHFSGSKLKEILPTFDETHLFISDYARNDVFIDKKLQIGKNSIVDKFKSRRKAIVYMPTHRSDGKKEMFMNAILPLDDIQKICEKYGYVFIIKKHFYHRHEKENVDKYSNIIDITNADDIDPQVLLCQADVLISDYSACYIDFLLLDRPLLFYQYDYEEFQISERSLYIPFTSLDIAPIAYNKEELIEKLESLITSDIDNYKDKRNAFASTYFENLHQANGREKAKLILDKLMKKYYPKN